METGLPDNPGSFLYMAWLFSLYTLFCVTAMTDLLRLMAKIVDALMLHTVPVGGEGSLTLYESQKGKYPYRHPLILLPFPALHELETRSHISRQLAFVLIFAGCLLGAYLGAWCARAEEQFATPEPQSAFTCTYQEPQIASVCMTMVQMLPDDRCYN